MKRVFKGSVVSVVKMMLFLVLCVSISFTNLKAEDCLKFGAVPSEKLSAIEAEYHKWKEWIEKSSGLCVKIMLSPSYEDTINKLQNNELDIARLGPFAYILAKQQTDIEPIVVGIKKNGQSFYKSYLVGTPEVSNTLGIRSRLSGEKGMKQFAARLEPYKKKWVFTFTDTGSTSGYAVPNYYMLLAGIQPEEWFKKIAFVGSHDAAELVVANNIIPLAGTADKSYNKLIRSGAITAQSNKILWESDPIPDSPIVIKKSLSEKTKKALLFSLLNMPKEYVPSYGNIVGYEEVDEKKYHIIEELYAFMNALK